MGGPVSGAPYNTNSSTNASNFALDGVGNTWIVTRTSSGNPLNPSFYQIAGVSNSGNMLSGSSGICAVAGVLSYSTFLFLLCRGVAVGNRKDGSRLELSHRVASFIQAASDQTGQPLSDCPALSEILATVAST